MARRRCSSLPQLQILLSRDHAERSATPDRRVAWSTSKRAGKRDEETRKGVLVLAAAVGRRLLLKCTALQIKSSFQREPPSTSRVSCCCLRHRDLFEGIGAGLAFRDALFDFSRKPVPPNVRASFILKSSWWLQGSRCLSRSLWNMSTFCVLLFPWKQVLAQQKQHGGFAITFYKTKPREVCHSGLDSYTRGAVLHRPCPLSTSGRVMQISCRWLIF